jgi:hypothetical protein
MADNCMSALMHAELVQHSSAHMGAQLVVVAASCTLLLSLYLFDIMLSIACVMISCPAWTWWHLCAASCMQCGNV